MINGDIRAASWNVNGLNNPVKRSRVMSKIKRQKIQILFLQETHLSPNEHEKLQKFGFRNVFYSSFKTTHKRGVAVLIHNSLYFELTKQIRDKEGRYILVQGKIEGSLVTLLSIYMPQIMTFFF